MTTQEKTVITVENIIDAPVEKVWKYWTEPDHITKWNFASDDWQSPWAKNDLKVGGTYTARMEAKDGSMGFDFAAVYDDVKKNEYLALTMGDGRKMDVSFKPEGNKTHVIESFDAEGTHSVEMQKSGWQAILDNFKKHVEGN